VKAPDWWRGWAQHTPAERADAVREINEAGSVSQIAAALGTTKSAVSGVRDRAGIKAPVSKPWVAQRHEQSREATDELAKRIRDLATRGMSAVTIRERLGLSKNRVYNLAQQYDIALPRHARPNQFRTKRQQDAIATHRERMWTPSRLKLPPVAPDEAARLVADFIARRGVTECPPAAPVVTPCNAGMKWR